MATATRNEAAERLLHYAANAEAVLHPTPRQPTTTHICLAPDACDLLIEIPTLVKEALAAERRATVQRIRYRLTLFTINPNGIETPLRNLKTILAILDEEAMTGPRIFPTLVGPDIVIEKEPR